MKTRAPPPEKGKGKVAASAPATPEMIRFRKLAKSVIAVDKDEILDAEKRERKKPKS
jgi:hypothetical protein